MRQFKQKMLGGVLSVVIAACLPMYAYAQSSSSTNYRVDQTFFGSGGELDASSTNYRAKQTAGELTVGNVCSTSYCAWTGFNTTDDPYLEFVVTGSNIDLGYLDTGQASTANGQFAVRAWQAGGYTVRTESNPPTNNSGANHQLAAMAPNLSDAPVASSPGTEQFGINLVANTSPATFGQNVQPNPNGSFPAGTVAANYATANAYKYVKSDTIASSNQSTSMTAYTISYVFNISNTTPAGLYNFSHILVVTATY